jgi:uncharacterized membrane-anchored protein
VANKEIKEEQPVIRNAELEKQLTGKNAQYIFDLKKVLAENNYSHEQTEVAIAEMLPQMIEGQKKGLTGRVLYGTVSHRAIEITGGTTESLSAKNKEKITAPFWMWLDNFLLLLGVLGIVSGILGVFQKGKGATYGILTLIIMSAVGGLVFYIMWLYVYQYEQPGADKSKRPGWLKTGLILLGSVLVWFALFTVTMLPIFAPINVLIPAGVTLVVGVLAIGIRFLIRQKYDIQSSMQTQPRKK